MNVVVAGAIAKTIGVIVLIIFLAGLFLGVAVNWRRR